MNCNPANYYPFNEYTVGEVMSEMGVFLFCVLFGLVGYIIYFIRRKTGKIMTDKYREFYAMGIILSSISLYQIFVKLPIAYGRLKLHNNYIERATKVISIDFTPKKRFLTKCVIAHKVTIEFKEYIHETVINDLEIIQHLKNYKSESGNYWIYYDPKNPNIYLADFRGTVENLKSVCEDSR